MGRNTWYGARAMHFPTPRMPRSLSHWLDPFLIIAIIIAVYTAFRTSSISNLALAIWIVLSISVVMVAVEFLRAPWSPTKHFRLPKLDRPLKAIAYEVGLQWLGLVTYFAVILCAWWLLAEYYRPYYKPFFAALPLIITYGPVLSAMGLFAAEVLCGSTLRGGRELGLFVVRVSTGKFRYAFGHARWIFIRDEMLSWMLWGFFLPLNFSEIVRTLSTIRGNEHLVFSEDWAKAQFYVIMMVYGILIASITPGYLFSSRVIRTETRGIDHSWFGWTVTLACYDPLISGVFTRWLDYRVDAVGDLWMRPWVTILSEWHTVFIAVGGFIIFCEIIHLWGEAQFGLRSSNLSNRGVITAGPYRFTKHPVYVSKCVGWLLIWLPFLAGGSVVENVRLMILWGFVCVIYLLRALAEERVLSKDPDYVAYALYMDERGWFRWVNKITPVFSFRYRLEKWRQDNSEHTSPASIVTA